MICRVCNVDKDINKFYINKRNKIGYSYSCKECDSVYWKAYYQNNKEEKRAKSKKWSTENRVRRTKSNRKSFLKRHYDITENDFADMVSTQNNCCKICGEFSENLHIDHSHSTGKLRGLLCPLCNRGLGHFKDSVDIMSKAIQYINDTENQTSLRSRGTPSHQSKEG